MFQVLHSLLKKKKKKKKICTIIPCSTRSKNYMSYEKKSQFSKKKSRIEVAEDPQKRILKPNYQF